MSEIIVECIFDKNHKVRQHRVPNHMLKCSKNHPEKAAKTTTCPYNTSHYVFINELEAHMRVCDNRDLVQPPIDDGKAAPYILPVNPNINDENQENNPNIGNRIAKQCQEAAASEWHQGVWGNESTGTYDPKKANEHRPIPQCVIAVCKTERKHVKAQNRRRHNEIENKKK